MKPTEEQKKSAAEEGSAPLPAPNGSTSRSAQRKEKKNKVNFNPIKTYKSVFRRLVELYKNVFGLIVGGHVAYVNNLPPYKRKFLRSAGSRVLAFFLRPLIKKDIRNRPFQEQLRIRLEMLGPTYVKLGQIMAIREDILPDFITEELENLLDRLQEVPFDTIKAIIEDSLLRPVEEMFADINPHPIGSASIGQTHLATTLDGERVVLKIIKPGIRDTILSDIKLLKILGTLLEWVIPSYQPKVIIDEFCTYTEKETDLTYEADHAELFAANFVKYPDIVFPRIYREYSTNDVLCMEFFDGFKPNDPKVFELSKEDQDKIIDCGTSSIIKMLYEDGFFHADLHAGNLIILPGPKIGFIDVGMVGRFEEKVKLHMLYYFYSLVNNDIEGTAKHLLAMARIGENGNPAGFTREVSDLFRRFRLQTAHGNFSLAQLILESLSIGSRHRIFFPVEMTLMVKALVTFEGVGLNLDPNLDIPELSRKHVKRIYTERYNPDHLVRELMRGVPELVDVVINLPKLMSAGSRSLEQFLSEGASENPLAGLKGSLMGGACIVGGVIAFVQQANPLMWIGLFLAGIWFYWFGK